MITTHVKQPGETVVLTPLFDTQKPMFEIGDVTIEAKGLIVGARMPSCATTLANGDIRLHVSGGTDGERYLITVRGEDTDQATLESELELAVIEASWQMPDGGTPAVTIVDFVNRFGLDEVVRMTDGDGSGRIDRQLLTSALTDAQSIAWAHVAGRYALPLQTVPPIVALAIADIARARLYTGDAPKGVETAEKNAMRTLERIQSGVLPLGLPEPDLPATSQEDCGIRIADGMRAYPDGLRGY